MFTDWYARWMYAWETRLSTRDENRVVRPLEWGFEWVTPFLETNGFHAAVPDPGVVRDPAAAEAAMLRINELLVRHSDVFFGYERPTDFRLEERYPQLFPTNVRPETLAQDAALKQQAAEGKLPKAQYLRFTSPERTPYPENDLVNARWYPAPDAQGSRAAQAGHRRPAAVERRRLQPQLAVRALQSHGRLGAAALQALSRHSPSRGA